MVFHVTIWTHEGTQKFDSNQSIPIPVSGMPLLGTMTALDGTVYTVSAQTLVNIVSKPADATILVEFKD